MEREVSSIPWEYPNHQDIGYPSVNSSRYTIEPISLCINN